VCLPSFRQHRSTHLTRSTDMNLAISSGRGTLCKQQSPRGTWSMLYLPLGALLHSQQGKKSNKHSKDEARPRILLSQGLFPTSFPPQLAALVPQLHFILHRSAPFDRAQRLGGGWPGSVSRPESWRAPCGPARGSERAQPHERSSARCRTMAADCGDWTQRLLTVS